MKTKSPLHVYMAHLQEFGPNQKLDDVSPEGLQYLFDIEEWFADNTAKFLADEKVIPRNIAELFFKALAAMLKKAMQGFVKDPNA